MYFFWRTAVSTCPNLIFALLMKRGIDQFLLDTNPSKSEMVVPPQSFARAKEQFAVYCCWLFTPKVLYFKNMSFWSWNSWVLFRSLTRFRKKIRVHRPLHINILITFCTWPSRKGNCWPRVAAVTAVTVSTCQPRMNWKGQWTRFTQRSPGFCCSRNVHPNCRVQVKRKQFSILWRAGLDRTLPEPYFNWSLHEKWHHLLCKSDSLEPAPDLQRLCGDFNTRRFPAPEWLSPLWRADEKCHQTSEVFYELWKKKKFLKLFQFSSALIQLDTMKHSPQLF